MVCSIRTVHVLLIFIPILVRLFHVHHVIFQSEEACRSVRSKSRQTGNEMSCSDDLERIDKMYPVTFDLRTSG